MYVCICNAIRECELRKAARSCRGDAENIYIGMGRPPQCGQCLDEAEEIVSDERLAGRLPVPVTMALTKDRTFQPMHS